MTVLKITTQSQLDAELEKAGSKLSVLDFGAKWCQPCQVMVPEFEKFSKEFPGIKFMKIDVDDCPEISDKYQARSLPTFVFVKERKEIDRFIGAVVGKLGDKLRKLGGDEGTKVSHVDSFSGEGKTLAAKSTKSINANDSNRSDKECEAQAREAFPLDKDEPSCKIQVRLTDGKRLSVELNSNTTIGTLRDYITIARPGLAKVKFSLITAHPLNKDLEKDEELTLSEAGLANSVINLKI